MLKKYLSLLELLLNSANSLNTKSPRNFSRIVSFHSGLALLNSMTFDADHIMLYIFNSPGFVLSLDFQVKNNYLRA